MIAAVAIQLHESGGRVSNTWAIYLSDRDNLPKGGLIPDIFRASHEALNKVFSLIDEPAAYQLVGGVTAHQGYDG